MACSNYMMLHKPEVPFTRFYKLRVKITFDLEIGLFIKLFLINSLDISQIFLYLILIPKSIRILSTLIL